METVHTIYVLDSVDRRPMVSINEYGVVFRDDAVGVVLTTPGGHKHIVPADEAFETKAAAMAAGIERLRANRDAVVEQYEKAIADLEKRLQDCTVSV